MPAKPTTKRKPSTKRTPTRKSAAPRKAAAKAKPTPRSQHLLTRGLTTIDQYIDLCQTLISDLTGGKVTKREGLQSIRRANKWLLARSRESGW